jgi:polysaccharide transporter, PST family
MSDPEKTPAQSPSHSKLKVNRGIAWVGLASSLVGGLDLAAQVILLHFFLTKTEYGIAALAVTLFSMLDQATDMGLSSAVIQRDDHSEEKISTVFWLNLGMSLVLFGVLFLTAPLYARWQGHPVVGDMLIAYGGKLIFQNLYFIPSAMMRRELRFKELSIIRIIANLAEFAGKVGFAAAGLHVWALVLGPLMRVLVTGVGVQLRHPWRPRLRFRPREAAAYARFGIRTSASQVLFHFYTMVDYPVVNKFFGTAALGLYKAAYELVLEPVRVIKEVIGDIAFPTFSRLRTRPAALIDQFIVFTRQNLVAVVPFVAVILLAAEQVLTVAWGGQYAAAAPAARVLCLVALFRALSYVVPPLLDGMGYPSSTLLYTAVASVVLPACYVVFAKLLGNLGYLSVAIGWAVGYPVAFAVLAWLALARMGMAPLHYLRRIAGIPACTAVAMVLGLVARALTAGLPAGPRLLIISVVTIGSLGLLLAYFEGISPRRIARALSRSPATDGRYDA